MTFTPHKTADPGNALPPKIGARDLDDLVRSNAITEHQRDLLISNTEPLEDLWANPYLRSVRDHSRAYIEHLMFGGFGAAPRPNSDRGI